MRYAENPPKKYEDIVNPDFACDDAGALWNALRDVVLFWIDQGVKIFRVDNPHTKPLPFLGMADPRSPAAPSRRDLPGRSLYAAEADEGPRQARLHPVLHLLHLANRRDGSSSNISTELTGYPERDYYRPNFFVNTPDILPYHLQGGETWMFKSRVALAATLSAHLRRL